MGSMASKSTSRVSAMSGTTWTMRGNSILRASPVLHRVHGRVVRRLRRCCTVVARHGEELERDAVHVDVLGLGKVRVIAAAQSPADDLLAQELRLEGAQAEDLRDVPSVPAFGEHGNETRQRIWPPGFPGFADRGHQLSQLLGCRSSQPDSAFPSASVSMRTVTGGPDAGFTRSGLASPRTAMW